ncbi:MAG: xylulokinase [Saccharofermentanaceae bacterium]|nr:xylulokinase [Saccharofermentanaceae bacterium]
MKYLIGIDIGTSGTKTALFSQDGKLVAAHTVEYPLYQPQNGYAEQDPDDWWNAALTGLKKVVADSGVNKEDIAGIGLSGQMHGLVMLDKDGKVLRKSIIWCDQRTAKECEEITGKVGLDKLMAITASPALTGFTASKILWVRNNEPEIYSQVAHILLPKDYVRYRLTGEFATDVSDASGMQLLDIKNRNWSDEVLQLLDIKKEWLAKVYESVEVSGRVTEEIAAETGLPAGIPVAAGAGDNAAAAIGCGVVKEGTAFVTLGTSGVVFAHTDDMQVDPKGRVHTFCSAVPGCWHVMGVHQAACLSLKWFKNTCCDAEVIEAEKRGIDVYQLLDEIAKDVPIGANRLLYLPYLMGERTPHLDPNARGVFFGLSAMHERKDMLRAVMEGVVYALRDSIDIFNNLGVKIDSMYACGGGSKSKFWRQMLADVFDCTVNTCASDQGGALGAALLASVAAGVYPTIQEACGATIFSASSMDARADVHAQYEPYYQIYKDLYAPMAENFKRLANV